MKYKATLSDGRAVTVESDHAPSEDEILQAVGAYQSPTKTATAATDGFSIAPTATNDTQRTGGLDLSQLNAPAEGELKPLSTWESVKFKLANAFGMPAEGSESRKQLEVIPQAAMIAPLGLPERLGKVLMTYFAVKTTAQQPAAIRQVRQELKQGDYSAAQRMAVEDLLNLGIVGTGMMGTFGAKPTPSKLVKETAAAGAPLTSVEVAKTIQTTEQAKPQPEKVASETVKTEEAKPKEPAVTPAIQTTEGHVVTGKDHVDAYTKAKEIQPDTSGSKEGFVDKETGQFISREDAAAKTGLPTETEPGKLHSSDLEKPSEPAKSSVTETITPTTPVEPSQAPATGAASRLQALESIPEDMISEEQKLERDKLQAQSKQNNSKAAFEAAQAKAGLPKLPSKTGGELAQGKRGYDLIDATQDLVKVGIDPKLIKEANPNWKPTGAARKIFRKGGLPADIAATRLYESGHYKGDPAQVDQLGEEINLAAKARIGNRKGTSTEKKVLSQQESQTIQFQKDIKTGGKDKETVVPDDLNEGDEFTLNGKKLKVIKLDYDEDGNVTGLTLDDGGTYGTQFHDGQTLLKVDEGSVKKSGKEDLTFEKPESVEEQKARLAQEESQRLKKSQAEELARLSEKPLVGSVGDIGQADMLGGGDLLSQPLKKLETKKVDKSPAEVLNTSSSVKVSIPKGATMLRVSTESGGKKFAPKIISKSQLESGNIFKDAGVTKIEAGTMSGKEFVPMKGEVKVEAKSEKVFPTGPGAATRSPIEKESDIGRMETNIPPLEKLTDAVKDFPKQPGGGFRQKLEEWKRGVGIPTKDTFGNILTDVKAQVARLVDTITKLPEATDIERSVGIWDANDQEGSLLAHRFARQVRDTFKNRSKLSALSKYIEAEGDSALLNERAAASKTPELRKAYLDAAGFGGEEKRLAADIRQYFDEMLSIAQREGALEEGVDNYIHRYYREKDPRFQKQMDNLNWMKFTKNFNGFKKRFYATDFEAEQAGLKPESDIAKRILAYDQGFRRALTARAFVKSRYAADMKDGRPELDVAGIGVKTGDPADPKAILIKPKWKQNSDDPIDYRGDYVPFDHPAFRRWKFATKDAEGKPVFVEGDILVHPDAAKQYRALFEKSWWSKTPFRRGVLKTSATVKQTMLDLSGFHPFQIAVHAAEHRVNPFKLSDLNPTDPLQRELMEGGLTIADTHGEQIYSEGVYGTGLTEKLPVIGEQFTLLRDAIFKDFIPRVKMTMAKEALGRNLGEHGQNTAVARDYKAGKLTREQVVRLTARESNAAFGEQNYRALFRHKSFQDTLRFMFLAPDFGEARLRFPLQAFTKYGSEQRQALILGGAVLFTLAKIIERSLTGENHFDRPFTVTYKGREYGIRNVASDLYKLVTEPNAYIRNRLNPIYTRAFIEFLTSRDAFGRTRTKAQQLLDEAKTIIPISLRGFGDKRQQWWESFANSMGIVERQRTAHSDIMRKINDWRKAKGYESAVDFVYDPDKDPYSVLTHQLTLGSDKHATAELNSLIQGKSFKEQQKIYDHYRSSLVERKFLTGSREHEKEFLSGLSKEDKQLYNDAIQERKQMWQRFQTAWRNRNSQIKPPPKE